METVVHELSNGMIMLVILVAFWLGICFIAGMRSVGAVFAEKLLEATDKLKQISEDLNKNLRG